MSDISLPPIPPIPPKKYKIKRAILNIIEDDDDIDLIINNIDNLKINNPLDNLSNFELLNDKYDKEILIKRFEFFKNMYISDKELLKSGLPIRHQNTPEDITENIK